VDRANRNLTKAGYVPLPEGITPHRLRHTFTSVLGALGTDPRTMELLGHTDPHFTLGVYGHSMRPDEAAKARLRALTGVAKPDVSGTISGTNALFAAAAADVEADAVS